MELLSVQGLNAWMTAPLAVQGMLLTFNCDKFVAHHTNYEFRTDVSGIQVLFGLCRQHI